MNQIGRKLFLSHSYFTIAIRRRAAETILQAPVFKSEYVLPASVSRWCADPILAEEQGKTWLFYEAVELGHGHIEVAEVLPDCSLAEPTVLLKDGCHYSYPFVFHWNDFWYMIPESSAAKEIRLYRADSFPLRWSLQEILLQGRAVDTTVYEQNGRLILLTFLSNEKNERVTPAAYELELSQSRSGLRKLEWADYDELKVRGAGPVFSENGILYRPVQINQEQQYGDSIAVYELQDSSSAHFEFPFCALTSPLGHNSETYFDGAHTYCRSSQYEAIDLRCHDLDLWKLPRRLLRRMKK